MPIQNGSPTITVPAAGADALVPGKGPAAARPAKPLSLDKLMILLAFVALFAVFSITANNFFTARNVLTLALQTSTITIMGIGVTFTIITGGIDLSIGSIVALSGTLAVMAANAGMPIWLSMVRRSRRYSIDNSTTVMPSASTELKRTINAASFCASWPG